MLILGLTGSIGMGKSTAANIFRRQGVNVHDADAAVHAIYRGEGITAIEEAFPGSVISGQVDRTRLSQMVLGNENNLALLERIVHPMVETSRHKFIAQQIQQGSNIVVLDIPLLFETGAERAVDLVAVVSASDEIQKARVMARPGMTEAKLNAIKMRQTPNVEKRRRAHFVIDSSISIAHAESQICGLLRALAATL